MIVGILTTCHTQYTWDRNICVFLFNRTTLQVFVTYLTGALYVQPLWFYKHQHDNRVRSKLFVACQQWWFQWRFWIRSFNSGILSTDTSREFLNQHLPQRWIRRGTGDQMLLAWPPRSPDATPCDFFLWGYVKDQVYVPPLPAKYPGTEGTNQNRHWNHHRWHTKNSLERTLLSCWCL